MPKIAYKHFNFRSDTLQLIHICNEIIEDYAEQGFILTLRQLYYQLVAKDMIENTTKSYNRIGGIVNKARLAGCMDWDAIEDRTRNLQSVSHWDDPSDIVQAAAESFRMDKWEDQPFRPEVWVEKEALAGVVEPTCQKLDIAFFCCRGYVSQSEMWRNAMRLQIISENQSPLIIHLGDHDPSGIDMTRDIIDRQELFNGGIEVRRIALNMDQIEKFKPPPNPAKVTDSRFNQYVIKYGNKCWELDALSPTTLAKLISDTVLSVRDESKWDKAVKIEEDYRDALQTAADEYDWESEV